MKQQQQRKHRHHQNKENMTKRSARKWHQSALSRWQQLSIEKLGSAGGGVASSA